MGGFQHILVPLDGTEVSELALQAAQKAVANNGTITLLRVVDLLGDHYLPDDADKEKIRGKQIHPAVEYLDGLCERLRSDELAVKTSIASGAPSDAIVEIAQEKGVDCIAMCTHTEAKVRQFLLGSVAQRVMRSAAIPVMVVHPES